MITTEQDKDMDAYIPPQDPSDDLAHQESGIALVESYVDQNPLNIEGLIHDPAHIPPLQGNNPEEESFLAFIPEEVVAMLTAVGRTYTGAERDLSRYREWLSIYRDSKVQFQRYLTSQQEMNKRHPEYAELERIKDFIYVLETMRDDPELFNLSFVSDAVQRFATISVRGPNFDEIKALSLYAFAHFLLPIGGRPSLISQLTDPKDKKWIFSLLQAFCNHPANTPDIRGAFLLLAMYSVLNLDMPASSRMEQFRDFFFRHMQVKSHNEKIKEKLLRIYALIAKSDPNRYGDPKDGKIIVEYAQSALMVSCPYISEELTQIWGQYMQTLIDLQKSGQLKVSLKRDFVIREAQALITPSDPNIPRCQPSAIPVLQQIVKL
jgi:hypothetical protein